jgi:hypothetical protein
MRENEILKKYLEIEAIVHNEVSYASLCGKVPQAHMFSIKEWAEIIGHYNFIFKTFKTKLKEAFEVDHSAISSCEGLTEEQKTELMNLIYDDGKLREFP